MVALVVVDGTGPLLQSDPVEYDKFYKNSFCSRLARSHSPSSYTRGPVVQGTDTREKGDRAFRVSLQMTADPTCKGLVLVGHSRGGRGRHLRGTKAQTAGHQRGLHGSVRRGGHGNRRERLLRALERIACASRDAKPVRYVTALLGSLRRTLRWTRSL